MKQLHMPNKISDKTACNPVARQVPLIDERNLVKPKHVQAPKVKTTKKSEQPKKKKLGAKDYATILSFVMVFAAVMSQASVLIGCAKSAIEEQTMTQTTVSDVQTADEANSNESFILVGPKQINNDAVKTIPQKSQNNDDSKSNESYR